MKKICIFVLILALFVGSSSAVGMAKDKVEIEFWTILLADAFGDYINGLIEEYEALNPNVKINWYDTGSAVSEYMTSLAAGNPPDVANMYTPRDFAAKGVIWNLDELLTDEQRDVYISDIMDGAIYEGAHYAIPWYNGMSSGMFYNKEIFAAAGLDPNKPPTTTTEMFEYAKIIGANTDKYGLSWQTSGKDGNSVYDIMAWEDVPLVSEDGTKAVINNPQAFELLSTLVDLYQNGGMPPEATVGSSRDWLNWFVEERAAMYVQGGWIKRYISDELMEKIEYVEMPVGSGGSRYASAPNWILISKASKHPEIAADFATFVTNTANQVEFCKLVAITPTTKAALDHPYFQQEPESFDQLAQQLEIGQAKQNVPQNALASLADNWLEMLAILKEETDKAMLGSQTVEETLKNVEDKWNRLL